MRLAAGLLLLLRAGLCGAYTPLPMQVLAAGDVGMEADIWSLGVVFYELATESPPMYKRSYPTPRWALLLLHAFHKFGCDRRHTVAFSQCAFHYLQGLLLSAGSLLWSVSQVLRLSNTPEPEQRAAGCCPVSCQLSGTLLPCSGSCTATVGCS